MRGWLLGMVLAVLATPVAAQELSLSGSVVVILDQDRLFLDSAFGRNVLARNEAEEATLAAENRKLEAAFEAEERSLTDLRARMVPEEFRKLADEFDVRVEKVRTAQEARFRTMVRQREEDRQSFNETALPVLGRLMSEMGAVVILDRRAIVFAFDGIDITDSAIARLDVELGDGAPELDADPAPETPVAPGPVADPPAPGEP